MYSSTVNTKQLNQAEIFNSSNIYILSSLYIIVKVPPPPPSRGHRHISYKGWKWLIIEWTVRSSMVYHSVRGHSFLCICFSKRRNWNWLLNALLTCIAHELRMENSISPYNVTRSRRTWFFFFHWNFPFLVLKTITKHVIQIFRLLQDMHMLGLIRLNALVHSSVRAHSVWRNCFGSRKKINKNNS